MLQINPRHTAAEINQLTLELFDRGAGGVVEFEPGVYEFGLEDEPVLLRPGLKYIGNGVTIKRADMPAVPPLGHEMLAYLNANFEDVRHSQRLRTGFDNHKERLQAILDRDDEFALSDELKNQLRSNRDFQQDVINWLDIAMSWHWQTEFQSALFDDEKDSEAIVLEGFTFDGNRSGQWEFDKYQFQHAHLLLVGEGRRPPRPGETPNPENHNLNPGRLVVHVSRCTFRDGVADGLSVLKDAVVTVHDCRGHDMFRGEITVTGGNSTIDIQGYKGQFVQVEIDGAGFDGSFAGEVKLREVGVDDFQVTASKGEYHVTARGLRVQKTFILNAQTGTSLLEDCQFRSNGDFARNHVFIGKKVAFNNCDFVIDPSGSAPRLGRRMWANSSIPTTALIQKSKRACVHIRGKAENGLVRFRRCRFHSLDKQTFLDSRFAGGVAGISFHENRLLVSRSEVEVSESEIAGFIHWGIQLETGGRLVVSHSKFDVHTAFWLMSTNNASSSGFAVDLVAKNLFFEDLQDYAFLNIGVPEDRVTHDTVSLFHQNNNISNLTNTFGRRLDLVTFTGTRTIRGREVEFTVVDDSPPGFPGDHLTLKNAGEGKEWRCTDAVYLNTGRVSGTWDEIP